MARRYLVEETPEGLQAREAEVLDRPGRVAVLGSPVGWRILQELARSPDYPSNLAARLHLHEQKVYYHVRQLESAGLLRVVRSEARKGAAARILAPTADAFAILLKGRGTPLPPPPPPPPGAAGPLRPGGSPRGGRLG